MKLSVSGMAGVIPPKAMDCPSEISSLTATRLAYYGHNWLRRRRRGYLVEAAIATSQRR